MPRSPMPQITLRRAPRAHPCGARIGQIAATGIAATILMAGCSHTNSTTMATQTEPTQKSITPATTQKTTTQPTPNFTYTPGDPKGIGAWIEVKPPKNLTNEKQAVLADWARYWQTYMQAINTLGRNIARPEVLAEVNAIDYAKTALLDMVADRKKRHLITVGTVHFRITSISIAGNSASVIACIRCAC